MICVWNHVFNGKIGRKRELFFGGEIREDCVKNILQEHQYLGGLSVTRLNPLTVVNDYQTRLTNCASS